MLPRQDEDMRVVHIKKSACWLQVVCNIGPVLSATVCVDKFLKFELSGDASVVSDALALGAEACNHIRKVSQLVLTIPGKAMSTKHAAFPELVSELRSSLNARLVLVAKCALEGYTASIQACKRIVDSGDVAIQAKLESTEVLKGPAVEELRAVWRSGRAKELLSAQGMLESFYTSMVELASLKLTVDGDDHTHDFQNIGAGLGRASRECSGDLHSRWALGLGSGFVQSVEARSAAGPNR